MPFTPPSCHPTLDQQAQILRQIQYDQTYARKELETLRDALEKRTTNLFRLQLGAITLTGALGFGAELLGSLLPM
jgi:hypothetical protein